MWRGRKEGWRKEERKRGKGEAVRKERRREGEREGRKVKGELSLIECWESVDKCI